MIWNWEKVDTSRSGAAGDVAKLFKNEPVKQPGVLGVDPPEADATILTREVIQNSWDAARELHRDFDERGEDPPEFRIRFEFRDLAGEDKAQLVERLGLGELAERVRDWMPEERRKVGLADHDVLDRLDGDEPLRLLRISEQATTGMYGPFRGTESKLYLALVSIGFTIKDQGAGGSYGYGKAGLIRGSATRTVVAYTCFRERDDEPGVTRRLLGMTYWGPHKVESDSYTGFARFGNDQGASIDPYENEEADLVAANFGLAARSPDELGDLGTTFLLVQPTVEPEDLRAAIERNWWPAIEESEFTAEIVLPNGEMLFPRPRKNEALMSFIRSWEVATVAQDNPVTSESQQKLNKVDGLDLGMVGLVADPDGWSWPIGVDFDDESDEPTAVSHRSLVALVRGPRMVVEYLDAGGRPPYVRGTFVAHDDVDDLLRQTEPKAHDSWEWKGQTDGGDGIDPKAPKVAKAVDSRVKAAVRKFRASLKPPTPKSRDIKLPVLEDLFKQLITGKGRSPVGPDPKPRMVRIRYISQEVEPAEVDDRIRVRARVAFSLSDNYTQDDVADVVLGVRFAFLEDQGAGERCPATIVGPSGFEPTDKVDQFSGRLGRDEAEFELLTAPYSADWSGRIIATGEIAIAPSASEGGDE